jgi:ABC-type phosphate/phosphonate transport system permease subunit
MNALALGGLGTELACLVLMLAVSVYRSAPHAIWAYPSLCVAVLGVIQVVLALAGTSKRTKGRRENHQPRAAGLVRSVH